MDNISDGLKRRFHDQQLREKYLTLFNQVIQDNEVANFL